MTQSDIYESLRTYPFLNELPEKYIPFIAECAELREYAEGDYLMRQGQQAECFYLMQKGLVSLRTNLPAQGNFPLETLVAPAALGWSWIVAPHKWHFDAVAIKPVKSILVHTPCLMPKMDENHDFGYEMYKRFIELVIERLNNVRMQMMDIYAKPTQSRL